MEQARQDSRFHYPDPHAKNSTSRTTRYRLTKKRKGNPSPTPSLNCESLPHCDETSDEEQVSEVLTTETSPNTENYAEIDILNEYFPHDYDLPLDPCMQLERDSDDSATENAPLVVDPATENAPLVVDPATENAPLVVDPATENAPSVVEKYIFRGSRLTTASSSLLIKRFSMRHSLTQAALVDLLHLLHLHLPSPHNLPRSLYMFNKQFTDLRQTPIFHYYCSNCLQELAGVGQDVCPNIVCGHNLKEKRAISSFIEISVKQQLTSILERKKCFQIISKRYGLRSGQCCDRGDIYDGTVYQSQMASGFLADEHNISLIFNTDGIPVFKSSSFQFWPLILFINELPYKMRIAKENRILAGLWYGCTKPDMSLFLKPLTLTLTNLYTDGIELIPPEMDSFVCRAVLIACTCDYPARAQVMNMMQYNGYYGCSHCYQRGETLKVGVRGRVHVFPYHIDDPAGPSRTHEETLLHAENAMKTGSPVFGVKGPSWLSKAPAFDMTGGMSFDYMHCVLLVHTRQLLRLWFTSTFHLEVWYVGRCVEEVDKRLCNIHPPNEIQRTPRCIATTMKYWKAHELRAWLLHYSPVVMKGVLNNDHYQHYLLLVDGIYLLLKDVVTDDDIKQSSQLLQHYCFLFSAMYGERYMTSCLHGLMHLPDVVRKLGPLWCHSCFAFEAANGDLLKMFHGSQATEKQIFGHICDINQIPILAEKSLCGDSEEDDFYQHLCNKMHSPQGIQVAAGVLALGIPHHDKLTDLELEGFRRLNIDVCDTESFCQYSKLYLESKNRIIRAKKSSMRDNSGIVYSVDGIECYGLFKKVILIGGEGFVIISHLRVQDEKLCTDTVTNCKIDSHIITLCRPRTDSVHIIPANLVRDKFVLVDVGSLCVYASVMPNSKEME